MTREEAITVFKAFMDNLLFSDVHKAAFSIAIHDIKQRHDWDINKLMLVPKTEWEQETILDKIRADIEQKLEQEEFARSVFRHEEKDNAKANQCTGSIMAYRNVLKMLDKYKTESEEI